MPSLRSFLLLAPLILFAGQYSPVSAQRDANAERQQTKSKSLEIPSNDDGIPGNGPIRRYEWFKNLWLQKRTQWRQEIAIKQNALVFLGDSITQGWGDDLGGSFPGAKVANRGISGDTTRGMLLRLDEDVLSLNPSGVVILMGTNDLEEKATPTVIASNVKLIIDRLKEHRAEMPIVLCKIFPSSAKKSRSAESIKATNQKCAAAVKGDEQITVLDTWTLFANKNGDAKVEEFPDLLHPNQAGYAKWAAALRPVLATLGFVERDMHQPLVENGYTSLFNGQDLTGWGFRPSSEADKKASARWKRNDPNAPPWPILTDPVDFAGRSSSSNGRYLAKSGRLVVTTPPEGRKIQQIWTHQEFGDDFVLKLEFRATPNADSGIFLRGKQLQCRDYLLAGPYKQLKKYRPQDWNEIVVVVEGNSAFCTCNGEVLEEAFAIPDKGPIGLEGDRGQIEYRNIRIKQISRRLPRSSPETQGVSSKALHDFVTAVDEIDAVHSFMFLRHGNVIAEGWWAPYGPNDPHQLYSLSKSFASTAVGLLIDEGKITLDDTVVSFFADQLPKEPSYNLTAMRIRDLLSMSTGHVSADLRKFSFQSDAILTREFLHLPVQHKPGTHFLYNTPATYMCSAIVQKVTGEKLVDYLQTRLFTPLGIKRPLWTESPQGIAHGGYGLNLRTEDIARFGQLLLQNGEWNGRQLVSSEWIAAATSRQVSNGSNPASDWEQGYGYQFWRCRHGLYRGDGAFGQFCIVMPQYDAVLAITSGTHDMGKIMQVAWDHLLPGLTDDRLPQAKSDQAQLAERLAALRLPVAEGKPSSPLARRIDGATFAFPKNDAGIKSVQLRFSNDHSVLTFRDDEGQHDIRCAHGQWSKRRMSSIGSFARRLPNEKDVGVAGSGAWKTDSTYVVKLWMYETTSRLDLEFKFNDDQLSLTGNYHASFESKALELKGQRQ